MNKTAILLPDQGLKQLLYFDRTGRSGLFRLHKNGKIVQRGKQWYPAELEEEQKEKEPVGEDWLS